MSVYTKADIITPANAITLAGLLLTVAGSFILNTTLGLGLVIFGRLLDLVDGPVARATRTTKFSIIWDPIADKLALLAMIIALYAFQLAPLWIVTFILVENVIISVLSLRAEQQGKAVGAVIPGKLNIFFQQSSIFLFVLGTVLVSRFSPAIEVLAYAAFVCSLPLGLMAVLTYARQATKATTE